MRLPQPAGSIHRLVRCTFVIAAVGLAAVSALAADMAAVPLSAEARLLVNEVLRSRDNHGAPFLVLDKRAARVWVFDEASRLTDSAPVLLGLAIGDDTAPGIADLPLSEIKREQRTTPAGRFVIEAGRNLHGDEILWIDYDAAVSMHRVRSVDPGERRLERLATPSAADNRISYGCINVPVAFFDRALRPFFTARQSIAYVLPEVRSTASVFPFMPQALQTP